MCLLVRSPKISVHMIGTSGWHHLKKSCWFIHMRQRTVLSSFGYWGQNMDLQLGPLSKLEFMQWKDVDRPTFTQICNSTINWLDYRNSFSVIQTDCFWQTICILERQLLVSITQNQHSSYSMSSSRNSDESCHLGVWLFHDSHRRTSHWLLSKFSASVNLFN